MARTYVLWVLPDPRPHLIRVHFPAGTQHSSPQCRSTKPQSFPQASARIFAFWVLSSNRDFTTPIWQWKAFSKAFQLSLLHLNLQLLILSMVGMESSLLPSALQSAFRCSLHRTTFTLQTFLLVLFSRHPCESFHSVFLTPLSADVS